MRALNPRCVEQLENRVLLAAFATLNSAGVLSVVGDSKSNVINVIYNGSKVKITRDGSNLYFDKSRVKAVWAEGFGGNDRITNGVPLPSTLIGDSGNDTLIGNASGDSLAGGSGNDRYLPAGNVGGDYANINRIDPGGGDDVVDCSTERPGSFSLGYQYILNHFVDGKDVSDVEIAASAGESRLTILLTPGNDSFVGTAVETSWIIDGGAGNDDLGLIEASAWSFKGGSGNDTLNFNYDDGLRSVYGGPGNDLINDYSGYGGAITCDGGSGYDTYNLEPDLPAMEVPIYDVTVPAGIEAFNLSGERALIVHGNDLDNNISAAGSTVTVYGAGGNDRLNVQPHSYPSYGGDDFGYGVADGGSGNDTLIGSLANVFKGGSGNDTADFSTRTDNLNITLDNIANDGAADENANVMADVETVLGGRGNDRITGNPFNNVLKGNAGNDTLWGGSGNDTLDGGSGRDVLNGQDGNDTLLAKDGRTDSLDGGAGFDKAQRDDTASIADQILNIEAFV